MFELISLSYRCIAPKLAERPQGIKTDKILVFTFINIRDKFIFSHIQKNLLNSYINVLMFKNNCHFISIEDKKLEVFANSHISHNNQFEQSYSFKVGHGSTRKSFSDAAFIAKHPDYYVSNNSDNCRVGIPIFSYTGMCYEKKMVKYVVSVQYLKMVGLQLLGWFHQ